MGNGDKELGNLSRNLDFLMSEAGISAEQLSKNTGIPATTIKRLRNDLKANPTLDSLTPIASFFAISVSELIGDKPISEYRMQGQHVSNINFWSYVPIVSWSEIPQFKQCTNKKSDFPQITTDIEISDDTFALIVDDEGGDQIPKSAILIVDPNTNPMIKDYVIVRKEDQKEINIKQYFMYEGQKYLKPLIADLKMTVFDDSFKLVGTIVQIRYDFRKRNTGVNYVKKTNSAI